MPIQAGTGDLFESGAEALVNPVNTVGVMGAGLALQFKQRYPGNFDGYAQACRQGAVKIGQMFVTTPGIKPKYIINFPTKAHWRDRSKIEYVARGLHGLTAKIQELGITSVAIPALGCGYGGLSWAKVEPMIVKAFDNLPTLVFLYGPGSK